MCFFGEFVYNLAECIWTHGRRTPPFARRFVFWGKALEAKEKYGTRKSRGNNEIFERVYFI